MSLPDDWAWLEEMPSPWSPPAELSGPTGMIKVDLPIRMLSSNTVGNDLIDLIGQLLSECARFSIWFGSEGKRRATSERELAELSCITNNQLRNVYESWVSYSDAYRISGGKVGEFDGEERFLKRSLLDAISNMGMARRRFEGTG